MVPAAHAGDRRHTPPVAIGDGGGGPRSHGGGNEGRGAMAKAVAIYGISTNWSVSGVADCVEGIIGRVIGLRWLLGAGRRAEKAAQQGGISGAEGLYQDGGGGTLGGPVPLVGTSCA